MTQESNISRCFGVAGMASVPHSSDSLSGRWPYRKNAISFCGARLVNGRASLSFRRKLWPLRWQRGLDAEGEPSTENGQRQVKAIPPIR